MLVRMELDEGHVNGARYVDVTIADDAAPAEVWVAATSVLVAERAAGRITPYGCAGVHSIDGIAWAEFRRAQKG